MIFNEGVNVLFKTNYFSLDKKNFIFPDNDKFDNENKIEFSLTDNLYNILVYSNDYNLNKNNVITNKQFKILNNRKIKLNEYESYFFIEKRSSDYTYILFNFIKDNIHYEVRISVNTFFKIVNTNKNRKTSNHEDYQILGFYYDTKKFNKNILKNDFTRTDFFYNDLNIDYDKLSDNKENILGSILFKMFLENNLVDNKLNIKKLNIKKTFNINDVIFNDKNKKLDSFLEALNKSENNNITTNFFKYKTNFKNIKDNTADCVLTNFKYDNNFNNILEKSIILSYPTEYKNNKYIEYWNDICYIIDSELFLKAVEESLSKKEKKDLDFYFNDKFQSGYYNIIMNKIFKYLDIYNNDYYAFVLVSLKMDKMNCQLGKATMIFKELFKEEKTNENILTDIYDIISDKVSVLFSKIKNIFIKNNKKYVNNIIKDIENIDISSINEKYEWLDNTQETSFIYNNKIAVLIDPRFYNSKLNDNHIIFKKNTSKQIDKYIKNILSIIDDNVSNIDLFNYNFSMIISNALLGDTNLPMYIVYGFNDKNKNPFITYSLHKMKAKKQYTHFENLSNYKDLPYIIHIKNFVNENNEYIYKSVDIYVFNYKTKNEDVYFCLRLGTKSSSHPSFVVETLPVNKNVINTLKKKIELLIHDKE